MLIIYRPVNGRDHPHEVTFDDVDDEAWTLLRTACRDARDSIGKLETELSKDQYRDSVTEVGWSHPPKTHWTYLTCLAEGQNHHLHFNVIPRTDAKPEPTSHSGDDNTDGWGWGYWYLCSKETEVNERNRAEKEEGGRRHDTSRLRLASGALSIGE